MSSAPERIQREQEFHDRRFAEDHGARSASRFYAVTTGVGDFYRSRIARIEPNQTVLELGCGMNLEAWSLAERGVRVTGIDISQVAIDQVRELAAERGLSDVTRFEQMNAEELTFPDGSFDVVIGNGILHHLDLDRALEGIRRVLRPGGWAAFREPLGHNPLINGYRKLTPNQRTDDEHPLLARDIATITEAFPDSVFEYFNLADLLALGLLKSSRFESVRSRLANVDRHLFARFPRLQKYGWMVGIEMRVPSAG